LVKPLSKKGKKGEKGNKGKKGERETLSHDDVFSILEDAEFEHLQDADRDQAAREIVDEYQLGNVGPDAWQARLRQIARLKMSRSPKRFEIVTSSASSDPSDDDASTSTTTTTAPSVPTFVAPSELTVREFFERAIYPSQQRFHYESHTDFRRYWHCKGWKRGSEYIDWQAEALRPKAPPLISGPSPSVPSVPAPVPSVPSVSTLPSVPSPSAPAKSAAEFCAEVQKVSP